MKKSVQRACSHTKWLKRRHHNMLHHVNVRVSRIVKHFVRRCCNLRLHFIDSTMSQNNIYCMSCRVVRLKNAVSNFKSAWRDFWENVGVSVEYLYCHCMWDSVCRNKATRRNKYKTQIANKSMDVKKGYRKYQDISVDNMSSGSKETHVLFLYFWCYKEPAPVQWYNNHD